MPERQIAGCYKGDSCLDPNGERAKPCLSKNGLERYYATSPLIPAEQLCLAGLRAHRESRSKSELVDAFASASYDLDRAIAIPRYTLSADEYIDTDNLSLKQAIFNQVTLTLYQAAASEKIANPSQLQMALQLRRLGVFMPAFRTRVESRPLTKGLIRQTHSGLCGYIQELSDMMHTTRDHHHKKRIASHKAECEVMGLLTRMEDENTFPYVALMREEASHARKQHNHDFYILPKTKKKAAQVKTSSQGNGYSQHVAVIRHYDILRALKRDPVTHTISWNPSTKHEDFEWPNPYKYEQVLAGDAPSPLAELLTEESRLNGRISRDKKNTLNLASSYVLSRLA